MLDFESVTGGHDFSQLDPTQVLPLTYACEDSEAALGAWHLIAPRLREWGLEQTFWDLEMPLCQLLVRMERQGVGVDVDKLGELRDTWLVEQRQLEREWASAYPGIKLQGPSLQNFFALGDWPTTYDDGTPVERNDSGKGYSTERDVLERLANQVDPSSWGGRAITLKVRHSLLAKLTGTYTDSLIDIAGHYPDGRLHVDIHQTQTRTGRLSCSYLQNVPTRSAEGAMLRQAIGCEPGRRLIGVDYSQIEPRYLAHLLGRGALFEAYQNGEDAYLKMAARIKRDRPTAKIQLLAIMYGIGIQKTARDLRISVDEAKAVLNDSREGMPEVFEWKERVWAFARKHGYVRTLSGRRRYLRNINLPGRDKESRGLRAQDERRACNTPIQGSARDVVAMAMLKVDALGLTSLDPCLQIHDEMLYECDPAHVVEAKAEIQRAFETAVQLKVPLVAEPEDGETWASVK
jgi:DNA polymerase-1